MLFSLGCAQLAWACSAALVLFVFYRVALHPAAKFPGPFLCKLTGFVDLYHAWRGDRHIYLFELHRQYGPVVRYAPNKLSFNTPQALHDIYAGNKPNIRKAEFYEAFPAIKGFPSTHSSIEKHVHSRKRRVLSHAFSTTALNAMEEYIVGNVRNFCTLLGDTSKDVVEVPGAKPAKNISSLASYLTFDVMGELCFGKSFGMLTKPDIRFVTGLIDAAAHRHSVCGSFMIMEKLHLDKVFFRHLAKRRETYMAYSRSQAGERTARPVTDRKDFFYFLLEAKDPETGEGFTMNELWSESNLLIVAGSDTSSTALAATLRFLALYPEVRQRLSKLVRDRFSTTSEIRGSSISSSIPYLRACIDEAMRLAPPVPGVLPRLVLADSKIAGHQVPAGVEVGACCYAIHHNADVYPKPETYDPSRWLESEGDTTLARSGFCPFSVGSRGCIGRSLAYVELEIAVARTVYMYDFTTVLDGEYGTGKYGLGYSSSLALPEKELRVGENRESFRTWDHFTCYKDGPLLRFTKVNADDDSEE